MINCYFSLYWAKHHHALLIPLLKLVLLQSLSVVSEDPTTLTVKSGIINPVRSTCKIIWLGQPTWAVSQVDQQGLVSGVEWPWHVTLKMKSKSCILLWHYPDNEWRLGCMWCSNCCDNGGSDCSFVPSKLGVCHLPIIAPTEAGNILCQPEASTPTPSPQSSRPDAPHPTSMPSITFQPSTSTAVSSGLGKLHGHVESIILGDFVSFKNSLCDVNHTSLSLEAVWIELWTMRSRELGLLKVLTQTIEECQQALSHLEDHFTCDIIWLHTEESGGTSLDEGLNVRQQDQPSVRQDQKGAVQDMNIVPNHEEEE